MEPVNEFFLWYFDCIWHACGPICSSSSDELKRIFCDMQIMCFICIDEEYYEKGIPSDRFAVKYFPENELNWK